MRRTLVALSAAALAASTLAFAPSVQQQATTHAVTFSEDGARTVEGGAPGGINATPFLPTQPQECDGTPTGYCETVLVEVVQPVADLDPEAFDVGTGQLGALLTPQVPASDFDLYLYESDKDGTRGAEIDFSAGFPGVDECTSTGTECLDWGVTTSEFGSTKYFLLEVYYFASGGAYTLDLTYERTDGRNAEGTFGSTEGSDDGSGDPMAPADSVERFDVAMFGEFDLEPAGDWGGGGDAAPLGSALGQDFIGAYLEYGDDIFTFTLGMTELPAIGGTPEGTRYGWSFSYNGNAFELDGKFTNYSRGACDPTAGTCPPPRDPGIGYFALRGNCTTSDAGNVTLCEELGGVTASFDPATAEIAIPIPASLLTDEVRACDTITGDASFIGNSVWAAPSAFVTSSAMPFDDVSHNVPLVVPPADPTLSC